MVFPDTVYLFLFSLSPLFSLFDSLSLYFFLFAVLHIPFSMHPAYSLLLVSFLFSPLYLPSYYSLYFYIKFSVSSNIYPFLTNSPSLNLYFPHSYSLQRSLFRLIFLTNSTLSISLILFYFLSGTFTFSSMLSVFLFNTFLFLLLLLLYCILLSVFYSHRLPHVFDLLNLFFPTCNSRTQSIFILFAQ